MQYYLTVMHVFDNLVHRKSTSAAAMTAAMIVASSASAGPVPDRSLSTVVPAVLDRAMTRTTAVSPQTVKQAKVTATFSGVAWGAALPEMQCHKLWLSADNSRADTQSGFWQAKSTVVQSVIQELLSAEAELSDLARLKDGWDGEGAPAPTAAAIERAKSVVRRLVATGSIGISVHADGRVIVERNDDDASNEIIVGDTGPLVVWSSKDGRSQYISDLSLLASIS
jgi:hypothetical protein